MRDFITKRVQLCSHIFKTLNLHTNQNILSAIVGYLDQFPVEFYVTFKIEY